MHHRQSRDASTSRALPPWRLALGSLISLVLLSAGVVTAQILAVPIPHQPFAQSVPPFIGGPVRRRGPWAARRRCAPACYSAKGGSVTFDRAGRIITMSLGQREVRLVLLDPVTLATEAIFDLPPRPSGLKGGVNFGGGYFFLDQLDRAVIPTANRQM
jgi:hypothetical protein